MPGFVIKDLPEELHRKLKDQAARIQARIDTEFGGIEAEDRD